MVSLARKNLLHDRLRFAITVAGVAFAVTLVLVQVGLFMGLLAKATVTIEHATADIWVTSKNTPNVDFAHTFPETAALRVRGVPGVERADNLIVQFMNIQLPNGAEEGCLVYALEDFRRWNLPNVQGETWPTSSVAGTPVDRSRSGASDRCDRAPRGSPSRFKIIGLTGEACRSATIDDPRLGRARSGADPAGAGPPTYSGGGPSACEAVAAGIRRRRANGVPTREEWARNRGPTGGIDRAGHVCRASPASSHRRHRWWWRRRSLSAVEHCASSLRSGPSTVRRDMPDPREQALIWPSWDCATGGLFYAATPR
jgi:hypothetical protein